MATSSLMGGETAPEIPEGRSVARLGPSNSSDSGSDVGAMGADASDSDSAGTGERASADEPFAEPQTDADILPDHVVSPEDDERATLAPSDARQLAQEQARSIDA